MTRHLLPFTILPLLFLVFSAPVSAAKPLVIESTTLKPSASPLDRYGNWQLRKTTASGIAPELKDALQRREETGIGSTVGDDGYFRVLSHRQLSLQSDEALYQSLEWVIDEHIHRTIWYHLYDGQPDKEAIQQLKSAFYSDVPADKLKNPPRHVYDGDSNWPFDLIDYLASTIRTPVIQIRLANTGKTIATVSELRFTHLLSWGGDADAEAIPTNLYPEIDSAILDWREPSQVFRLKQPLTLAPGETATIEMTIKVKDAAEGESGGMLLTLFELGYQQDDGKENLFVATLLLQDSLDDLAY